MNLANCSVKLLIFHLIAGTSLAAIVIGASKSDESSNCVNAAANVIKSCYGTRINEIGLVGNIPNSLVASLTSGDESLAGILLDNTTRLAESGPVPRISRYKLQFFALTISSSTELEGILMELKHTRWWNHLADFYIIDWPVKEHGCSEAHEVLWAAWKMNLLEAKFMCAHRTKGRLIYSFNPYIADAPKPWQLESTHRGKNNHPWSLLVREYSEVPNDICKNMNFDKTKNLGGYEIRTTVTVGEEIIVDFNKTGIDSLDATTGDVLKNLFRALNATITVLKHEPHDGYVDENGIVTGIPAETANGISDIGLNHRNQLLLAEITSVYPFYYTGLSILTHYKGDKSQLRKIFEVVDVYSRIGMCVVCLITLLFLKYFQRQRPSTVVLNIIRMICNTSITNLSNNVASRIYLIGLFMFIVTIQAIYQGQLASLLAKREPLKDVNTMQDLAESDHVIYSHFSYIQYFDDRRFYGRIVGIESSNCTKYVLENSSVACVDLLYKLMPVAARSKLHLSSDSILKGYSTWAIREDWPLEQRINKNLQRLAEANAFEYSYEMIFVELLGIIDANNDENKDRKSKILSVNDLGFAFAILVIGLMFATISFIVEVAIG